MKKIHLMFFILLLTTSICAQPEKITTNNQYKPITTNQSFNTYGYTSLMLAVVEHDVNKVTDLLSHKNINVNATTKDGWTALMNAALISDLEITKLLVEKGANVNAICKEVGTALMVAIPSKNIEVAKYLINKNTNLNASNQQGFTALMVAADSGNLEITKLLIDKGAPINAATTQG